MDNDIKSQYISNIVNLLRDRVYGKITIRFTDEVREPGFNTKWPCLIVDLKNMDFCYKWMCPTDIYELLSTTGNPYEKIADEFLKEYRREIIRRYIK